jgi:phage terminase large subunit
MSLPIKINSPAAEKIAAWRKHPTHMVRELFGVTPDAWQEEALESFAHSPRLALKSCKGPGKSALLAWCGWNFLLCHPHAMIGATSISGANLKANLWTELARWRGKSALLQHCFEQTKTEIFAREHPKTWRLEARTWPADADSTQIGNALAGLHASYVMWILDEVGDYPDSILPTCEAIFAGEPIEARIVMAGNPTRLGGPLYRACTTARNLWRVFEISAAPDDPKRTPRVSIEHARQMIQQCGESNPWIKVSIFGQFPPSSLNALIGPDEVSAAMKRFYRDYEIGDAARVLGVDVARYGDDASVIFKRQGIQALPILRYRNLDSTQGAGQVSRQWQEWSADAAFIDDTGGFGSGWIDQLRQLGRYPVGVHFAGEAHDKARYVNKRAEMYFDAVAWIKRGGALPDSPELLAALTQTTYTFQGDRFLLEPKDQVKAKLGYSPDEADAFALTFAEPVWSKTSRRHRNTVRTEWDPFRETEETDRSPYA